MIDVAVLLALLAVTPPLTLDTTFELRPAAAPASARSTAFLEPRSITFTASAPPASTAARSSASRISFAALSDTSPATTRPPLFEYHDGRVLDWRPVREPVSLRPRVDATSGELLGPDGVSSSAWTIAIGRCPVTGR